MQQYPTYLTEKQSQVIKKTLERQKKKRKHTLKEIMNVANECILYRYNS